MFKDKILQVREISRNSKIALICIVGVIVFGLSAGVWAVCKEQKHVAISIDNYEKSYTTYAHTVADLLTEKNIILGENDKINVKLDQQLKENEKVVIRRSAEVQILADGETLNLSALDITVADALDQVCVTLDEDDTVTPELDHVLTKGLVIDVNRIDYKEEIRELELSYGVDKQLSDSLAVSEEQVISEGVPGEQVDKYLVTYSDGKVINEKLLDSKVQEPVNKVVATGLYNVPASIDKIVTEDISDKRSAVATVPGSSAVSATPENPVPNETEYTETFTVKATAYTHDGSRTKMGTECRVGAIAVDPSVIPLGTKLYVEGYGYCTAEDTGGKIKGNRIDVFLNTEAECVDWGVKSVVVYILK